MRCAEYRAQVGYCVLCTHTHSLSLTHTHYAITYVRYLLRRYGVHVAGGPVRSGQLAATITPYSVSGKGKTRRASLRWGSTAADCSPAAPPLLGDCLPACLPPQRTAAHGSVTARRHAAQARFHAAHCTFFFLPHVTSGQAG